MTKVDNSKRKETLQIRKLWKKKLFCSDSRFHFKPRFGLIKWSRVTRYMVHF